LENLLLVCFFGFHMFIVGRRSWSLQAAWFPPYGELL
jgi:hypothetical protein